MDRRRLPIGIQTFRQIREEDHYYVDKTGYARLLADDAGKHYFLSRPRRFGKSLFVDTLKELYEGADPREDRTGDLPGSGPRRRIRHCWSGARHYCRFASVRPTVVPCRRPGRCQAPMGTSTASTPDAHGRAAASACAPARMLYRP